MHCRLMSSLITALIVFSSVSAAPPETSVDLLLDSDLTILGDAFAYPAGRARITAARLTVPPGGTVPLHLHQVPLFVYILQGEISVDYGSRGTITYRKGDTFVEAFEWPHHARNAGKGNVKLLAIYVGAEGVPNSIALE